MNFRRTFLFGLLWRVGLVLLTAFALVEAIGTPGLGAARLLAVLLCIAAVAALWRFVQRTNVELARFVEAVRFDDLSQNFMHRREGSGFGEFGDALEQGIRRLREERHRLSDANRFYEAVLDDAPTALLTVDGEGRVELANKAARRMLARHKGIRIEDFCVYGDAFAAALTDVAVGRPQLVPLGLEAMPQIALLSAATVHRLGGTVRVVAIQPIQTELNAAEIAAQRDMVRVLTHEIMNSMTPVTSLAQTAAQLIAEADRAENSAITDARAAIETLARRAEGLMHFVQSYRQISRTPDVRQRRFEVLPWARELEALFRASPGAVGVVLTLAVEPEHLTIDADPDLMCQVLLNLLKNGAEAALDHAVAPEVSVLFSRGPAASVQIDVADNGPGVPETLHGDVFLPFFTTKAKGTGVGLSLARHIVLAHRGEISLSCSDKGGALFRIIV